MIRPRELLERMLTAAIDAAQPEHCLPRHLPTKPEGRVIVLGAGKASAAMAKVVEKNWDGELSGLVVTRHGYEVACKHIEIVQASHPVPDEIGLDTAKRMMSMVEGLTEKDLVLCLISGGGSALLPLPMEGLTLADKQQLNKALLASGATISEINCVRRHLSAIKGGRLAAACHPARVVTLLVSDVPGDNPMDIASGPTVPDTTTCADALAILKRYKINVPPAALTALQNGKAESVKPSDPRLKNASFRMIATPQKSLEAAARVAERFGIRSYILGSSLEAEAKELGKMMAGMALQVARHRQPFMPPCIILSGGETTVTVKGKGRGGRNVEFLLSLALGLQGHPGIFAMAADTDGVDGTEEIAGAFVLPNTLQRAFGLGFMPSETLENNDAHTLFSKLGDNIITGPTRTNVNDFRAILVTSEAAKA